MKTFTLFAGVNGAGKTSLYHAAFENEDIVGKRINLDEIVRDAGSWKNTRLQIEAGKKAILLVRKYLESGTSFHQETTLAGKTILRTLQQAKGAGYQVVLYYVGLSSPDIAKTRVKERVMKGGHGVDEEVIEKRYYKSLGNLRQAIELSDIVNIYDNSGEEFKFIMAIQKTQVKWQSEKLPSWLSDISSNLKLSDRSNAPVR